MTEEKADILFDEALEWYGRLDDQAPDTQSRNDAFMAWVSQSPAHVKAFFDVCMIDREVTAAVVAQQRRLLESPETRA